ncbi:MAG: molybdopterin-synthase adenylyltransferase MoeB [Pseudomonadota bacterium]
MKPIVVPVVSAPRAGNLNTIMALTPAQIDRYSRHLLLREIGGQGQQKLAAARILVVGAGGLGSPALLYLTAAGIGTLGIVDHDKVALSNLQRQIVHQTDSVGTSKTQSAARQLRALNSDSDLYLYTERLTEDNAHAILSDYDLVIDGVDNFATRFILNRTAIATQTPLVSAAVGRFEGQLATFKPWEQPGILPCYQCLVPTEPPRDSQINCDEDGVIGALTGVVGSLAAMEALKETLGIGESLAGRLMIYDGLAAQCRTVKLPADPHCSACG